MNKGKVAVVVCFSVVEDPRAAGSGALYIPWDNRYWDDAQLGAYPIGLTKLNYSIEMG